MDLALCSRSRWAAVDLALFVWMAEVKMDWQPIEAAPKDRELMLGSATTQQVWFGRWDDDHHSKKPVPYWSYGTSLPKGWQRAHQPTHWMPRPTPPPPQPTASSPEDSSP